MYSSNVLVEVPKVIDEEALDRAAKYFHLNEWQKEVLRDFAATVLPDMESSPRVHRPTMVDPKQLISPTFTTGVSRIPSVVTITDV